jgi:hypothetical protein
MSINIQQIRQHYNANIYNISYNNNVELTRLESFDIQFSKPTDNEKLIADATAVFNNIESKFFIAQSNHEKALELLYEAIELSEYVANRTKLSNDAKNYLTTVEYSCDETLAALNMLLLSATTML